MKCSSFKRRSTKSTPRSIIPSFGDLVVCEKWGSTAPLFITASAQKGVATRRLREEHASSLGGVLDYRASLARDPKRGLFETVSLSL